MSQYSNSLALGRLCFVWGGALLLCLAASGVHAQNQSKVITFNEDTATNATQVSNATPSDILSAEDWRRVDAAVQRGLSFLAARQQPSGAFPTIEMGQPGVTSLCMMAFMAHGHVPGDSQYGTQLEQAADFVMSCQRQNGLLALVGPDEPTISRQVPVLIGVTTPYNHAISSLMLCELYGMSSGERALRIELAVERALAVTLERQRWPKARSVDRGGWRYLHSEPGEPDSDLSITGWELMFLRSARNAGFDVRREPIDDAVTYIRRCYSERYGAFQYIASDTDHRSRGMAGAGILALGHAGFHNAAEARQTGDWILQQGFEPYNVQFPFSSHSRHERYHYSVLMCCQGMYQLGDKYWEEFFPRIVNTLLANQLPDGSWPADGDYRDSRYGRTYTTSLMVLSLGAPNQLLPIFQR